MCTTGQNFGWKILNGEGYRLLANCMYGNFEYVILQCFKKLVGNLCYSLRICEGCRQSSLKRQTLSRSYFQGGLVVRMTDTKLQTDSPYNY